MNNVDSLARLLESAQRLARFLASVSAKGEIEHLNSEAIEAWKGMAETVRAIFSHNQNRSPDGSDFSGNSNDVNLDACARLAWVLLDDVALLGVEV